MSFHKVKHMSLKMRQLMLEEDFRERCHDCDAKVGEEHKDGCDVARCDICGGQALSCGCTEENHDVWTGYWPGCQYCCDNDLVCYDTASKTVVFDLNTYAIISQTEKRK